MIVKYPNKILDTPTTPVEYFSTSVIQDIRTSIEVLIATENAAAIAANQVGSEWNFFTAYDDDNKIYTAINPEILYTDPKSLRSIVEGCLSFTGTLSIHRYRKIEVKYLDPVTGKHISKIVRDVQAQIFQHEIEHLSGTNFSINVSKKTRDKFIKNQ